VLDSIQGFELPLISEPQQLSKPNELVISSNECEIIDETVVNLLTSGAIEISMEGQFISRIFTVPKSDGSSRS